MRAVGGRNENRLSRRCPKLRGLVFWGGGADPRAVLRLVRDGILQVWGQCWGGKWGRHRWLMAGCPCQRGGRHLWHRHSAADPLHRLGGSQTCALMPPRCRVPCSSPPDRQHLIRHHRERRQQRDPDVPGLREAGAHRHVAAPLRER